MRAFTLRSLSLTSLVAFATGFVPALPARAADPTVLVIDMRAVGVDEVLAAKLTTAIASTLATHGGYRVVTLEDIKDLLNFEAQKQLLGCDDDTCMAELSSRANADLVVSGSVGTVGQQMVVSLSLVDAKASRAIARASEILGKDDDLDEVVSPVLAQLFGWEGATRRIKYTLPEGKKMSFAVFDLHATGVDENIAKNLTQILSVEVKRVEGASVISRDDIVAMLQLDATKASLGCEDDACIAEIGGALGVDKLIAGSVGKLADSFVVTLRLIDAGAAHVDNRVTETFRGQEDQLIRAVRFAGRELLGISPDVPGMLAVSSTEQSAEIYIDHESRGELPLPPIGELSVGRHTIRMTKGGFYDWQTEFYVDPDETTVIWAQLQEQPEKWYEKWWLWTIVGAAVVGGVTAAVVLAQPAPTSMPATVVVK